ncbi:unnamed protein product [Rotaria sordida]|uniref:Uncharacterized protein n=1 Tax=Rotaria sordida TaxID=392033 RepID=A0A814EGA0_9BILA|nr:unnamed protein product [Rotaria sordida]CAF1040817.1 unnamed protein product [Rotaria sordida]CAF1194563.1 unnamed protein product [Rotaria sordida]CAF3707330.1 unnamed protein product [Rotaria sordida]
MKTNAVISPQIPIFKKSSFQTITIQNGDIRIANHNFSSPFSTYEIRLLPSSIINIFKSATFNPIISIKNQEIHHIYNMLHGSQVGMEN